MQIALEVEFLAGRYHAASHGARDRAEFPPHPARILSALVATVHESGLGADALAAVRRLERLPPPALCVAPATERPSPLVSVPQNGTMTGAAAINLLPGERASKRSLRHFPSSTLTDPRVHVIWTVPDHEAPTIVPALQRIASEVVYIGSSASFVRADVVTEPPPPTLVPDPAGTHHLRVPYPGFIDDLHALHDAAEARRRPPGPGPAAWATYAPAPAAIRDASAPRLLGDWIVFARRDGTALSLAYAHVLTTAVRRALMGRHGGAVPRILSGHEPDRTQARGDHIAVVPLADVGNPHGRAHADLKGFAIVLPATASAEDRRAVLRAIRTVDNDGVVDELDWLNLDRFGAWSVARQIAPALKSLSPQRYVGEPSRTWATVTPYLFDIVPTARPGRDVHGIVARSCHRMGLPDPASVAILDHSPIPGVPRARDFRILRPKDRPPKLITHLAITFHEPVAGPVLIGSGRYQGLGLFLPVAPEEMTP